MLTGNFGSVGEPSFWGEVYQPLGIVHSDLNSSGNVSGSCGCQESGSDFKNLLVSCCLFCVEVQGHGGSSRNGQHTLCFSIS